MVQTGVDPGSSIVGFLQAAHAAADGTPPDQKSSAKQVSDSIDADIAAERARRKANKEAGDVGLLLLGQSESGKSTLLKQFRMIHSLDRFESERSTWRPVILLNVFNTIRNVLSIAMEARDRSDPEASSIDQELLKKVEQRKQDLAACEEKLVGMLIRSGHVQTSVAGGLGTSSKAILMRRQGAHSRNNSASSSPTTSESQDSSGSTFKPLSETDKRDLDASAHSLEVIQDSLTALWKDPGIKKLVKERLQEDWRDYFMTSLPSLTSKSYIPTDADILHVRMMTMGVVEHSFRIPLPGPSGSKIHLPSFSKKKKENGDQESEDGHDSDNTKSINMHIYDVGGARGQRHTWASYFDGATAIIFLAPISVFDQFLTEDSEVNRIRDSMELFTKICDNKLLADVQLVLFLNKCDILEQKLNSGIRIKDYIPSYGDQPNTDKAAKKYFASHFNHVFTRSKINTNGGKRNLFIHFTSVVDSKATKVVIGNVQDSILQKQMKDAKLI